MSDKLNCDSSRFWASLVAQMVKNPPAMWVRSLGSEDSLQEGMATHCSILAWRIPCTEEPGRLQSMRLRSKGRKDHLAIWENEMPNESPQSREVSA